MDRRVVLRDAFGTGVAGAVAAACREAPMRQEPTGEFTGRGASGARADQIRRAGAAQGRVVETRAPGVLRVTSSRRSEQAVVDVPYDARRSSNRYADRPKLKYDGVNIDSNRDNHVQRLPRAAVKQPAT